MEYPKIKSEIVYDSLGNSLFRVTVTNEDKTVTEKTISYLDYMKLLGDSGFEDRNSYISIGPLPKGYVNAKLNISNPGTFKVMVFYPGEKRAFCYGNYHYFVPFPPLVFTFDCVNGSIRSHHCYATCTDSLTPDTPLMMYPFGNVSDTGSICMGNIETKQLTAICDIDGVVESFFMSETNNDYYSSKNTLPQEQLIQKIKDLQLFPVELLKPDSKNRVVKDVLD